MSRRGPATNFGQLTGLSGARTGHLVDVLIMRAWLCRLLHPILVAFDDLPLLCDCDERGPCQSCEPA